jgi:hypothetical protein
MKATLFSADFVKDANGGVRLLELNTDTGVTETALGKISYTALNNYITSNNLTKITVVAKAQHHRTFVDDFETNITNNVSSVTEFNKIYEPLNASYPTAVTDEADRLILRLAYDEAAVFDSTYCKTNFNTYNLFVSDSAANSGSVAEFYYSSSAEGELDYLTKTVNSANNVPDAGIKANETTPIKFYKLGDNGSGVSASWDALVGTVSDGALLTKYHYNSGENISGSVTSIRSINVLAGTNLDLINLTNYKTHASFDLPSDISSEVNAGTQINELHTKHYYEYATNMIKHDSEFDGVHEDHKIIKADDTAAAIKDLVVGDQLKSYFISGSPDTDDYDDLYAWTHTGKTLPSGSYLTSSAVVSTDTQAIDYNGLLEVVVDSDAVYVGTSKSFLLYESSSNKMNYEAAVNIDPADHYFVDIDGNLIDIDECNVFITNDDTTNVVEIDIEDTDTYMISGSTAFNSIVSHNAPCFVAGTEISLANGDVKYIENIVVGDVALTYNHETNEVEEKEVEQVISKRVTKTVKYTLENDTTIEATVDHPLYCQTCDDYCSYDPELTKKAYGLTVGQIEAGMELKGQAGPIKVTHIEEINETSVVYNLNKVAGNHNFYANAILVHNRGCFVAGSLITLEDGSTAPIEEIKIDDAVLTYNEAKGENEAGKVGDLKIHEVDTIVRLTLENSLIITTTPEHPFYVIGKGYVKAADLDFGDECLKTDGSNSFISTKEIIEETHEVYNLLDVSGNHNFYVNGILVHNKA